MAKTLTDIDLFPFEESGAVLVLFFGGATDPQRVPIEPAKVAKLACLALAHAPQDAGEWSEELAEACSAYLAERKP